MDKSIWLRKHRGEGQPAVSRHAKLITSQQHYCTIKYSTNTSCLLRVTSTTPLLPNTFCCVCVCVWIHAMNSWYNVNLVHILGFKTLWPNLTSKKPYNQIPNKNTYPNTELRIVFIEHTTTVTILLLQIATVQVNCMCTIMLKTQPDALLYWPYCV